MKTLYESLLDDFDTLADFQDLTIILDDPNFNKNNFNKMKRLFKKAGGGEDYTKEDDKNETTYFICFDRGGLNNTSEIKVGIPAKTPTLTRTYFPGYRHTYYSQGKIQVQPNVWAVSTKVPAKNHFWRNTAGPISIPEKYVPYFERLIQTAPEWGSKEYFELNDKKKIIDIKSLYESLLDDFDTIAANADPRKTVEEFLDHNFSGTWHISDKPNKDGYYEVSSNFSIHSVKPQELSSLTNGLFIWTKVKGSFSCQNCIKLTSLKGGPKEVGKIYQCSYCPNLETLEGGPDFAGYFDCSRNENLISLEGGPKVTQNIFDCSYCQKLKSLKGAPEISGKCFTCKCCGERFSTEEVKKYTKAKKIINI